MYRSSSRRYRPQTFADVIGQEAIVTTLKNAVTLDRLSHAYLFSGPHGTGKTTLARLLAKRINCAEPDGVEPCNKCQSCKEIATSNSLDVLEIDGASHRGIDDVREMTETVGYAASGGKHKIYIIDEAHMLTREAFNALLKTLEEPPPKVKFFLATTEPHKLPATIISRCQRFELARIAQPQILGKLQREAADLGVQIDEAALHLISAAAEGAMRDAESLFDQVLSFHGDTVDVEAAAEVLGLVPRTALFRLDQAAQEEDLQTALSIADELFARGKNVIHFIEMLIEHMRTHLLFSLGEKPPHLSSVEQKHYAEARNFWTRDQCLSLLDLLVESQSRIKEAPSPRLALEMLLLRFVRSQKRIPIETLVGRLLDLEKRLEQQPAQSKSAGAHPETALRFAAVELEGTVSKGKA